MEINNNSLCFTHSPLGDRKKYQEPDIWVGKSQLNKMICGGGSGNEDDEGGGANVDHRFWDNEDDDRNIWDKEE